MMRRIERNKILRFITDSEYRFITMGNQGFYKNMPDDVYLKRRFKAVVGMELNLEHPRTFNEKIQWLKINDRNPLYATLVDKYEVKRWVEEQIGEQHVIPTYGVYNSFEEINFGELPNSFVMKCTHDSGSVILCKDKSVFDVKGARKKINRCLKNNLFYAGREWAYKDVKPRIIIEKYMGEPDGKIQSWGGNHKNLILCNSEASKEKSLTGQIDYKLMCFNGKVKCTFTCTERYGENGLKVTFFDNDWNVMPFERHYPKSLNPIQKPKCFNEMVFLAEKLSKDIPFVRVDFYEFNGRVLFGEMTLYPGCGMEEFHPVNWDYKLGDMLTLTRRDDEIK